LNGAGIWIIGLSAPVAELFGISNSLMCLLRGEVNLSNSPPAGRVAEPSLFETRHSKQLIKNTSLGVE
jgi:hypothetical protein